MKGVSRVFCFCVFMSVLTLVGLVFGTGWRVAHARTFDENKVRAVFLYNLTKFVRWDVAEPGIGTESEFVIGILGSSRLAGYLAEATRGERVAGRKIRLTLLHGVEEIPWREMEILVIGAGFNRSMGTIVEQARRHHVLTVGSRGGDTVQAETELEADSFCARGGMVNLRKYGKRIVIELNPGELERAGLQISSQVLRLAHLVETDARYSQRRQPDTLSLEMSGGGGLQP